MLADRRRVGYVPQDPERAAVRPDRARRASSRRCGCSARRDDRRGRPVARRAGPARRWPSATRGACRRASASGSPSPRSPWASADVLLLDEPTRGMDAPSQAALERAPCAGTRQTGGAVVLATHDVELAARCATRVVVLGDGEVVAAGRRAATCSPGRCSRRRCCGCCRRSSRSRRSRTQCVEPATASAAIRAPVDRLHRSWWRRRRWPRSSTRSGCRPTALPERAHGGDAPLVAALVGALVVGGRHRSRCGAAR